MAKFLKALLVTVVEELVGEGLSVFGEGVLERDASPVATP